PVPSVVLGHVPRRRYRLPPYRRHPGFLTTDGIVAPRAPHVFPEQDVAPHRPTTLLLAEADEPDHYEDVTGSLDAKLAALLEHRSQYRSTMRVEDPDAVDELDRFRRRIRDRTATWGRRVGVAHAEAFKRISEL